MEFLQDDNFSSPSLVPTDILNELRQSYKKIMVLYTTPDNGGKAKKTKWVMHQYHLGTKEDEREGEYVTSKVFYQQQQAKLGDKYD